MSSKASPAPCRSKWRSGIVQHPDVPLGEVKVVERLGERREQGFTTILPVGTSVGDVIYYNFTEISTKFFVVLWWSEKPFQNSVKPRKKELLFRSNPH